MPHWTDITGLAGVALVSVSALLSLPGISRLSTCSAQWLFPLAIALMLIPFGSLPLAAYVRGATGDFSITTVLIAFSVVATKRLAFASYILELRRSTLVFISTVAICFYPLALGVGAYDPYQLGYGDTAMVGPSLFCATLAWWTRNYLLSTSLSLALLAWVAGWYESDNLWDYLIDPFVGIHSLTALTVVLVRSMFAGRSRAS